MSKNLGLCKRVTLEAKNLEKTLERLVVVDLSQYPSIFRHTQAVPLDQSNLISMCKPYSHDCYKEISTGRCKNGN